MYTPMDDKTTRYQQQPSQNHKAQPQTQNSQNKKESAAPAVAHMMPPTTVPKTPCYILPVTQKCNPNP